MSAQSDAILAILREVKFHDDEDILMNMLDFIVHLAAKDLSEASWFTELRELTDSTEDEEIPLYRKLASKLYQLQHPSSLPSSSPRKEAAPKEALVAPAVTTDGKIAASLKRKAPETATTIDATTASPSAAVGTPSAPMDNNPKRSSATGTASLGPVRDPSLRKKQLSAATQSKLDAALSASTTPSAGPPPQPYLGPPHQSSASSSAAALGYKRVKKAARCTYFPNCRFGDQCEFIHPSEPCKNYPHCAFGDHCLYLHPDTAASTTLTTTPSAIAAKESQPTTTALSTGTPSLMKPLQAGNTSTLPPCGYGAQCTRKEQCPYMHPKEVAQPAAASASASAAGSGQAVKPKLSILRSKNKEQPASDVAKEQPPKESCKFGELCRQRNCPLRHPSSRMPTEPALGGYCRFARNCTRVDCTFDHAVPQHVLDTMQQQNASRPGSNHAKSSWNRAQPARHISERQFVTTQDEKATENVSHML